MKGHIQQRGTSMAKRSHGDGGINQRGENIRVGGPRFARTLHDTLTAARKELRALRCQNDRSRFARSAIDEAQNRLTAPSKSTSS